MILLFQWAYLWHGKHLRYGAVIDIPQPSSTYGTEDAHMNGVPLRYIGGFSREVGPFLSSNPESQNPRQVYMESTSGHMCEEHHVMLIHMDDPGIGYHVAHEGVHVSHGRWPSRAKRSTSAT